MTITTRTIFPPNTQDEQQGSRGGSVPLPASVEEDKLQSRSSRSAPAVTAKFAGPGPGLPPTGRDLGPLHSPAQFMKSQSRFSVVSNLVNRLNNRVIISRIFQLAVLFHVGKTQKFGSVETMSGGDHRDTATATAPASTTQKRWWRRSGRRVAGDGSNRGDTCRGPAMARLT